MNKCINLRYRKKNYQTYAYCTILKTTVKQKQCVGCNYLKTSDYSSVGLKKHIKKVSKKRAFVNDETYTMVFNRDNGKCSLCGSIDNLQLHHISGRGKYLTNDIDNCIILCFRCHHEIVHKANKMWRPKLKEIIAQKKN